MTHKKPKPFLLSGKFITVFCSIILIAAIVLIGFTVKTALSDENSSATSPASSHNQSTISSEPIK